MTLISNFHSFFRGSAEGLNFPLFSKTHIFTLLGIFFVVYFINVFKDKLRHAKFKDKLRYLMAIILILQQITLYSWYIFSNSFTLGESLPLYHCRIAIIATVIMLLNNSEKAFSIAYFWGVPGALLAMIYPQPGDLALHHISYYSFFGGHGIMLIAVAYMIFVYNKKPSMKNYKYAMKFTVAYVILMLPINSATQGNYGFLHKVPKGIPIAGSMSYPYFVPIVLLGFLFGITALYMPYYLKDRKEKREEIESLSSI